jgi:hypothetical protein
VGIEKFTDASKKGAVPFTKQKRRRTQERDPTFSYLSTKLYGAT